VAGDEISVCLLWLQGHILYIRVGLATDSLLGGVSSGLGLDLEGRGGMGGRRRYEKGFQIP
jgi:hypothetical protein